MPRVTVITIINRTAKSNQRQSPMLHEATLFKCQSNANKLNNAEKFRKPKDNFGTQSTVQFRR